MNVMVKSDLNVRDAFRKEDYSFTVDWLNVRLDCDNLNLLLLKIFNVFPEIDISDWQIRDSGVCFYKEGIYLPEVGYSSVVISFNRDENGNIINAYSDDVTTYGILVSISGDGCRYINSLHENGFVDLLKVFEPFNPHCSRIDIACDIFDKENQIVPMLQTFCDFAYDRENALIDFNCNLHRKPGWVTANLVYDDDVKDFTRNITIGGRSCKKGTVQLYNKKVEVQTSRLSDRSEAIFNSLGNPDYWWRLEYRCKSFAQRVYDTLVQSKSIYNAFLVAANDMGTFVIPKYGIYEINKADPCIEWVAFLDFVLKLSEKVFIKYNSPLVNIPYVGSELERIKKFHRKQIYANDCINFLLLMLDSQYRQEVYNDFIFQLNMNVKLRKAIKELQMQYGFKLNDLNEHFYSQSSLFDEIA